MEKDCRVKGGECLNACENDRMIRGVGGERESEKERERLREGVMFWFWSVMF